jgi:hypothetical protein
VSAPVDLAASLSFNSQVLPFVISQHRYRMRWRTPRLVQEILQAAYTSSGEYEEAWLSRSSKHLHQQLPKRKLDRAA